MIASPRPRIAPVAAGVPRPLWSVMIPTFNCANELRAALASVLAQDPGPELMHIEVVDDCSSRDDPAAVVAELGAGRVQFHRQERNVGHTRNFNTCLQRSRGLLVHLLHGDDFVYDGFYATMGRPFDAEPAIGAAFCQHVFVDGPAARPRPIPPPLQKHSGVLDDWLATIAVGQRLQPAAMVVRRAVYERLGGFDQRLVIWGDDWEMWVRIAAAYPVWYQAEPLAAYRIHGSSLTGHAIRSGQNLRDARTIIDINHALLPPARAAAISRAARQAVALSAIRKAHRMMATDRRTPLVQLREAVRTSPTPAVGVRAALLLARWTAHGVARTLRVTRRSP